MTFASTFESAFKHIENILRREGGNALKYTEQTSWLLFLKYLDALEYDKTTETAVNGRKCEHLQNPTPRPYTS